MLDFLTALGLTPGFIEFFSISLLNGVSYGLLLFMLSWWLGFWALVSKNIAFGVCTNLGMCQSC